MGISDARLYLFAWGNLCVLKWYWRLWHCTQFNKIYFSKPESAAGEVRFLFLPISLDFILFFFYFVVLSSTFSAPPLTHWSLLCVVCWGRCRGGVVLCAGCEFVTLSPCPRLCTDVLQDCGIQMIFPSGDVQSAFKIHTHPPPLSVTHTHTHALVHSHTHTDFLHRQAQEPSSFLFLSDKICTNHPDSEN